MLNKKVQFRLNRIFYCNIIIFFLYISISLSQSYTQSSGTVTKTNQAYTASSTDESGVLVQNSGIFTLTYSTIKTTGNTSSSDNSSFLGLNAGVLAKTAGNITMNNCSVTTSGSGANGVFAYGTGIISLTDDTVKCTGQYAHGIMCSGGGTITAKNVYLNTTNTNSAAIATDRGSGTITVTGGSIITSGKDSPGIYSTGVITVSNATITSTGSEAAAIEGLNSVTLSNVTLSGGISTYGGVLVVQTMSGDASTGTAKFNMTAGSFTVPAGPLFFVTNTDAVVNFSGVNLTVNSGTLLDAEGTSRWGTSGKNGGILAFTADGQTLAGDVILDKISSITFTLKNSSTLSGTINSAFSGGTMGLSMDATSRWTVTGTSHLSTLSNTAGISGTSVTNIIGNGNKVYYNSSLSANSALGAKTYSLVNGGYLLPEGTTGVEETNNNIPKSYGLNQNYPNPFNPTTNISFSIAKATDVSLDIFNINGQHIRSLSNHHPYNTGLYSLQWNGKNDYGIIVPSGTYFYRLTSKEFNMSKKMVLMK